MSNTGGEGMPEWMSKLQIDCDMLEFCKINTLHLVLTLFTHTVFNPGHMGVFGFFNPPGKRNFTLAWVFLCVTAGFVSVGGLKLFCECSLKSSKETQNCMHNKCIVRKS